MFNRFLIHKFMRSMLISVFIILCVSPLKGQEINFSIIFDKAKLINGMDVDSNKIITFDGMFDKDVLSLTINEKSIYEAEISTNPFDGIAYQFTAIEPIKIKIGLNNHFVCLGKRDFDKYKYIYVSINNNLITIFMTNRQKLYK